MTGDGWNPTHKTWLKIASVWGWFMALGFTTLTELYWGLMRYNGDLMGYITNLTYNHICYHIANLSGRK